MPDRFFLAETPQNAIAILSGPEAHHLAHVLRAPSGMEVALFDGRGGEYRARVSRVAKQQVTLEILEHLPAERESTLKLALAVSLPKGDRQRWLIEKATELGVDRLIPLVTTRGVAQPTDATLERLRRGVIEACKQCGRNRLLEIAPAQRLADLVATSAEAFAVRAAAHPRGKMNLAAVCDLAANVRDNQDRQTIVVALGPEGGFTPEEISHLTAARWELVDLGPRILRVETAAIAVAACWSATMSRLKH